MSLFSFSVPRFGLEQLEREVETMSEAEKQEAENDVHGRGNEYTLETADFIADVLGRLESALAKIPEKVAFEQAQSICPEYVNSSRFRLMFLRGTVFDVKLAAEKIVAYWSRKLELFGEERTFHELSIRDMFDEDEEALSRGGIRALPERDEAGRGLIISFRTSYDVRPGHRDSMLRLLWLMTNEILKDVEVQKKGIVLIISNAMPSHEMSGHDYKMGRLIWRDVNNALPGRVQAIHQCIACSPLLEHVIESTMFVIGKRLRARYRHHHDAAEVLAHSLEPYRIVPEILPQQLGGTLDFDYEHWLEELRNGH